MRTRLINGPSPQPVTAIDEVEREAEDGRQRISAAEFDMERNLQAFKLPGEDVGPAELPGTEPIPLYSANAADQNFQLARDPVPQHTMPQITVNEPWNLFPEEAEELETRFADEATRQLRW